ncbi:MAG: hypothetical protein V4510_12905 [bacterium]
MAKGYNLKAALKVVNQLGKSMGKESSADYAVALSALTAGQKNLSKQTRAYTRDMLLSQGTNQAALGALGARARAQRGVVAADQAKTTSRYGAALGASVASQYGRAAAVAAGTGKVVSGQVAEGQAQGRIAETVAGIAQAGVAAQKQAAVYSMNQALQQRNIIDSQTLAGLTGDLYKTAMSYNMQWDMWKKQQDYAVKQADKAQNDQMKQAAGALPEVAASTAGDAYDIAKALDEADPENGITDMNVTDAVTTWANENGVTDDGEVALMTYTLQNIKRAGGISGDTASTYVNSAIEKLYGGMKGWDPTILTATTGAINSYFTADALTAATDDPSGAAYDALASYGGGVPAPTYGYTRFGGAV